MSTLPLEIRNAGAALSILGESCDYFQQIRELTENVADQAKTDPSTQVLCDWGYERGIFENGFRFGTLQIPAGTLKLACVDNGPGMDEKTLMGPIRSLFNSGTGHDKGNFGIGAKVAGLSRHAHNAIGMLFITKTKGDKARCAVLTADGLLEQDLMVDGDVEPWAVVPCELLDVKVPKIIEKAGHGTAVVLLGDTPEQDTVCPPNKIWSALPGKKATWLPQYLLRRYNAFPENLSVSGIEVGAYSGSGEFYTSNGRNASPVTSRPVRSFNQLLSEYKTHSGEIQLNGAVAHWYVLDQSKKTSTFFNHMCAPIDRSGVAVEWRDELYEREPFTGLAKFGVYTGERSVFIVIKPDADIVASNATRDALYIDGRPVRGDYMRDWATQFRTKVKDTELGEWLAAQGHKQSGDARNRVLDVLKKCGAQLKVRGFRLGQAETQVHVSPSPAGSPAVDPTQKGATSSNSGKASKGDGSLNLPVTIDPRGQLIGSPMNTDCAPDIMWESKESFDNSTRVAGVYALSGDNPLGVLRLNQDFKFFGELKAMLLASVQRYSKANDFTEEQLLQICQNLVEHAVSCEMSEAILRAYLNAKTLGNKWDQDRLDELFTPEVLAVMTLRSSTTVPYMVELFRGTAKEWINVK